jgi:hypothetical protein
MDRIASAEDSGVKVFDVAIFERYTTVIFSTVEKIYQKSGLIMPVKNDLRTLNSSSDRARFIW